MAIGQCRFADSCQPLEQLLCKHMAVECNQGLRYQPKHVNCVLPWAVRECPRSSKSDERRSTKLRHQCAEVWQLVGQQLQCLCQLSCCIHTASRLEFP